MNDDNRDDSHDAAGKAEAPARTLSEQVVKALADGRNKRVRKLLQRLHPAKIAALLERLEPAQRLALWQQIHGALEGRVLGHLSAELRPALAHESHEDGTAEADSAAATAQPEGDGAARQPSELEAVRGALEAGKLKRVGKLLHRMHPAKVAGLLEALPPAERSQAWSMVETERAGRVLSFLHDEISAALAQELDLEDLIAAVQHLELDDLVDLIQTLPAGLGSRLVLATTGADIRSRSWNGRATSRLSVSTAMPAMSVCISSATGVSRWAVTSAESRSAPW